MESSSWPESLPDTWIKAIQELTKGQTSTDKLREILGRPADIQSDIKSDNDAVVKVSEVFGNALSILSSTNVNGILYNPTDYVRYPGSEVYQKSKDSGEIINSKTIASVKTKRGCYKRKKKASTVTKVTSTLIDDGYVWRMYGQKTILNSKYQRNYYRCSHKLEQGCQATKQVQQICDKQVKYRISYSGYHTCHNLQRVTQIIMEAPNPKDKSVLISFETKKHMENNHVGTCFPSMKHTPEEGFTSLYPLSHEQVSTYDHAPWDPIVGLSQVPFEPMSMMSCASDYENMTSSIVFSPTYTHGYGIHDMTESNDCDEFIIQLW